VKKKTIIDEQTIQSHSPCSHDDCSRSKTKPCPYCGRINMLGIVHIQPRLGYVHYERLNETHKRLHIKLSKEQQEASIIELWIGPNI